jgi:hypothetical protein
MSRQKKIEGIEVTPEIEAMIRARYPHEESEVIAEEIGCTVTALRNFCYRVDPPICKSAEFMAKLRKAGMKPGNKKNAKIQAITVDGNVTTHRIIG